jgi:hypothetical protein
LKAFETKAAVLASVLGYPGAGQAMQRRWWAAALLFAGFTAAFLVFGREVFHMLSAFYGFAMDFNTAPVPDLSIKRLLLTFGAAIVIYIANIVDVVLAQTRMRRNPKQL